MAQNLIPIVEEIQREYSRGMPDGMNEDFLKRIPILFKRIGELEVALAPFARAFLNNEASTTELIYVYKNDCAKALDVINSGNGRPIPRQVEMPAE